MAPLAAALVASMARLAALMPARLAHADDEAGLRSVDGAGVPTVASPGAASALGPAGEPLQQSS